MKGGKGHCRNLLGESPIQFEVKEVCRKQAKKTEVETSELVKT